MSKKLSDRQIVEQWLEFRKSIRNLLPVDMNETPAGRQKRMRDLEADPQAWKAYYFPHYHKSATPKFHTRASRRMLNRFLKNGHHSEVRHWARGLAKSTLTMMDVLYLVLTGKLKNIILTSSTYDAAAEFLEKYRVELDTNTRIIHDYGKQELEGSWSYGDFTTRKGTKFMAIGARQSPRGTANAQFRPDCLIVDDFDTDEECMNPDIISKKWDWYTKALFFTVDISSPYLIIWLGNIIAPDCCIVRQSEYADHTETINIRDDNGKSVWPEKNSEEDIDYQISKVPWAASQQEMFNNPVRQGAIFKELTWGKVPPLSKFKFLVAYADPATSTKERTGAGKNSSSYKSLCLIGNYNGKYYVITAFVDQTSHDKFIDWFYAIRDYVDGQAAVYYVIENNTLQDPFYEEVFKPKFYAKGRVHGMIPIIPDKRKKPDKFFRIEAELEPLNRLGQLIFNEKEKSNPHMKRMEDQFLGVSPGAKIMDAPDGVEGGVFFCKTKLNILAAGGVEGLQRSANKKRF